MQKEKTIGERIDERTKQRTGLRSSKDIEIYKIFCHHAGLDDDVVLWGDVISDICQILKRDCSEPMRVLELAYNESVGNHEGIPHTLGSKHFPSPLYVEAKKVYGKYIRKFIKKGLVGISEPFALAGCYPLLTGYNYFNDSEFYKKTRSRNSSGRELRA